MSNTLGNKIKCTVFGQSHSEAIGVVIDGLPAGFKPDFDRVGAVMKRRAPGASTFSTSRVEADEPVVLSGLVDGVTCGAPLCAVIYNGDARSTDYMTYKTIPRPGHSDYTAFVKFDGANDIRGGGQFSGRLTAPLCFAGAICSQLLEERGVKIMAHIRSVKDIEDLPADDVRYDDILDEVAEKPFPTIDDDAGKRMMDAIAAAKEEGDSLGGVVECCVYGLPRGLGDPMFESVESEIAKAIFSIPAVKGIEFGSGFAGTRLNGSENNDGFVIHDGRVETLTNNSGGILGGITNGMPCVFRCAFKPTPSIAKTQKTVDLIKNEEVEISVGGRHDPCIVPRAVPVVEAVCAIALCNLI